VTFVLVLSAVELEARGLARELELPRLAPFPFPVYERSTRRARLRLAPAGLRAALLPDRWAALVADLGCPLVIAAGTCGALAPGLQVGDLVLPESVLGLAGERLNVTPSVHGAAVRLADEACTGLLLTSAEVVATREAKAERWRATGAAAVDMDSAPILAWASRQGCPSLVVRAVSDSARQHLPAELVGLVTREGKLSPRRAVALAVTRPLTIPRALALRRGAGKALNSVARLIAALFG
jgi:hypothetical protein